jgi:hypothetical protein
VLIEEGFIDEAALIRALYEQSQAGDCRNPSKRSFMLCCDIELAENRRDRFMRVVSLEVSLSGAEISQDILPHAH